MQSGCGDDSSDIPFLMALPYPARLRFCGGIPEQQGAQGFPVEGPERPEIAHAAEDWRRQDGAEDEEEASGKPPEAEEGGAYHEEKPVDPDAVAEFDAGKG